MYPEGSARETRLDSPRGRSVDRRGNVSPWVVAPGVREQHRRSSSAATARLYLVQWKVGLVRLLGDQSINT